MRQGNLVVNWAVATAVCLGLTTGARAQLADERPTIVPVDESPAAPSFHRFYRAFQRAVEDRDGDYVLSVIADDIHLSFGGISGRAAFIERWQPRDPEGPLWPVLNAITRLGGAVRSGDGALSYVAPYTFARWPDRYDAFTHAYVAGRSVRFRRGPSREAPVRRSASWEIMEVVERGPDPWVRLRAKDGTSGFVHGDFVRSPVGYRFRFASNDSGSFELTTLIAGD